MTSSISCPLFCSAVSRCYRYVCTRDVFSVGKRYHDHFTSVLCVLMVEGMSVEVNVMLSLTSVMIPPIVLCDILIRAVEKLCTLGVFSLGVSLVSGIVMIYACVL